ncbi:MAG: class II fumarate hydratase [Microthrixaceae bacterium]|nr:class II fumarate hydratase [Microthrixaceae bacterium]
MDDEHRGPRPLDIPVGLAPSAESRTEADSLGEVRVPAGHYWGAQTQRALENFPIGGATERMPIEVVHAFGHLKAAAAVVNGEMGVIPEWMAEVIQRAAGEVAAGELDTEFPVTTWQTGSGTQTNMNVNEVISNRCIQLLGGRLGSKEPVHPNDHVNASQSSNDTFPTAMHIAARMMTTSRLLPALDGLVDTLRAKSEQWSDVVKVGRTHLQDATPLTVGQEWSGFADALADSRDALVADSSGLLRLAAGGTAVGTGINTRDGFAEAVAAEVARRTGEPFATAPNKFVALGTLDASVRASAGLRNLAVTLFKIANDIRWLGSGPRTGLGELRFPANEPGSSIMPGKVNPTQAEAMQMVTLQVIGNDTAIAMAGKDGNLQLNTLRPLVISNLLRSIRLLADACDSFATRMLAGAELNRAAIEEHLGRSAMLVTALAPHIGYDRAASIAHLALEEDLPLREAALRSGVATALFDEVVRPLDLTRPDSDAP